MQSNLGLNLAAVLSRQPRKLLAANYFFAVLPPFPTDSYPPYALRLQPNCYPFKLRANLKRRSEKHFPCAKMLGSRTYINVRYTRSKQYVVKHRLYRSSGKFIKAAWITLELDLFKTPKYRLGYKKQNSLNQACVPLHAVSLARIRAVI